MAVPAEAVVLNFVVAFYDNYDNNEQRDHKVLHVWRGGTACLEGDGAAVALRGTVEPGLELVGGSWVEMMYLLPV